MTRNRLTSLFCLFGTKEKCRLREIADPAGGLPLSQACCRDRLKVCKINGDRQLCARMASLGVLPGSEVELLCPVQGQHCLIKINGGTISLDEPAAQNILVTPAESL